ncbi:MAG: formyltetrahydrofolate deformylase [Gammaproteobacteria bacterium]|nr:formyltetrahydrofolate deformylase [Gammaproteobacteria bacterium]MDH5176330.1 formyltetrahydrofolate deformylase [Gammaproteobacteria bacterium]MDH5227598.1 formyltetrahydrofolate deformylase [Gammaproteobacteria bacterium]
MSFDTEHPYVLTATCASRMGTTARVTTFLATRRFYIVEMQQFDDTISQRFFVRVTFCAVRGEKVDLAAVRKDFQEVADAEQMEWQIHDSRERARVLIMVSNYDHCLEDLLYRHRIGELKADITAIVSNHVTLQPIAAQHRIPFFHLPVTPQTKPQQEQRLLELVESTRTDLVVLARYMQILSDDLCGKLRGRAINIHHSFLPGFKGAKPYHQAYERGVKVIGATAHYVTADLDEGPIIEQIVEHVDHAYTPDMLVAAGRDSERRALSRAVRLATEQRVFLNGNRTVIFR